MRERLLENWLDRSNERGYQPVFCQALSARGFSVVHSTRHTSMELGKDVIARDSKGKFHAFQLKGNPGSRLTMSQWQAILPQINALMLQPIEPPISDRAELAVPYLVTNGQVDEDVHAAIRALGTLAQQDGREALRLISRGNLLDDFIRPIADETWPPSTEVDGHILTCWQLDGADYFSTAQFHQMLLQALPFTKTPRSNVTLERALFGAAIINEICLRRYQESENFLAVLFGRALFLAASYSLIERARLKPSAFAAVRELTWTSMSEEFTSLIKNLEQEAGRYYYDRAPQFEFPYHQQRLFLLKSILSVLALSAKHSPQDHHLTTVADEYADFIRDFVCGEVNHGALLGEYAVPQILFVYWYMCSQSGSAKTDGLVGSALNALLTQNSLADRRAQIPNPYYAMPDVLADRLGLDSSKLGKNESFRRQLWTALPLFGVLVRRNLKQTAKYLFSDMTKFIHRRTSLRSAWQFGLHQVEDAEEIGEELEFPAEWDAIVARVTRFKLSIPKGLVEDVVTLGLFLILCPFRLTEEVTYHLDDLLLGNWHSSAQK